MGALYAVSGAGNATSVLYMLDPATGAVVSTIGSTGYSHVTGLAFHPFTGVLYGVTSGGEEFSTLSQLLILDPFTGAGTPVGPTGFTSGVPDISFSPGGVLYAWYENGDDLATIDLTTGAGTVLGDAGISTARTGLAFNSAGRLWTKDDDLLYEISPADGTPIGSVTISVSGLHNALVFNQFDVMYGLRRTSGMELYTIDPTSGAASLVGSNALTNIAALAFGPVLT
jgi:hypothetical protein